MNIWKGYVRKTLPTYLPCHFHNHRSGISTFLFLRASGFRGLLRHHRAGPSAFLDKRFFKELGAKVRQEDEFLKKKG
jgi:hypothetical protein